MNNKNMLYSYANVVEILHEILGDDEGIIEDMLESFENRCCAPGCTKLARWSEHTNLTQYCYEHEPEYERIE